MRKTVICGFLLAVYTALVYWLTIFNRTPYPEAGCEWRPFWTYGAIADGRDELIGEIISNVLLFIPVGVLIGLMLKHGGWLIAALIAFFLSLGIELLQAYLKCGLCETDDIIHNTVGCLVGFSFIRLLRNYMLRYDS